jgi:hypothetical protein
MEQVGTNFSDGTLFNPPGRLPLMRPGAEWRPQPPPELGPFL